jgi:DNA (cytosine-5)-methyltransferase 1
MVLDTIYSDLESIGYEVTPALEIPACAVQAPHKRARFWIVAHYNCARSQERKGKHQDRKEERKTIKRDCANVCLAHSTSSSVQRSKSGPGETQPGGSGVKYRGVEHASSKQVGGTGQPWENVWVDHEWVACRDEKHGTVWRAAKSGLHVLDDGIPAREDLIRGSGNAIVPQVAAEVLKAMMVAVGHA